MATTQELFDRIVDHFIKQGRRAVDDNEDCMYRAPNGNMCAIGCLISDKVYNTSLENKGATNLDVLNALRASGIEPSDYPTCFLTDMQRAHDCSRTVDNLQKILMRIADEHGLQAAKVSNITNWE